MFENGYTISVSLVPVERKDIIPGIVHRCTLRCTMQIPSVTIQFALLFKGTLLLCFSSSSSLILSSSVPVHDSFNSDPSRFLKFYMKLLSNSRNMSTSSSNGLVVAALVLALMCGSVGCSRFMKLTASSSADSPPPPPVPWWKHPPPPPLHIQWPPPVRHYVRHPPSPPPPPPPSTPVSDDDSSLPPPPPPRASRLHQSPPPPPPDEDKTALNNAKHAQNGRRLFSSEDSGRTQLLVHTESSPEKCSDALSPGAAPRSSGDPYGGGGFVPVGAPSSDPAMSPVPAPAPSSDAETNLPAPPSDDNSTMAHTTMVSAMQYNQCTYTIITSTGNIAGAGTQADVNVEFFDKYGSSVLFVNLRSQNRNFNQGATDTFTVVGDCIQSICKMHLSHDDAGPNPGWFVNTVTVSLLYQTHVFNVFEWLAKDEPPYSLSRVVGSCPV